MWLAEWLNLPILRASPYFLLIFFQICPLNHRKFPNISPVEIVITFEACAALLKKSVENGHFALSPPWNFKKGDRYGLFTVLVLTNSSLWVSRSNINHNRVHSYDARFVVVQWRIYENLCSYIVNPEKLLQKKKEVIKWATSCENMSGIFEEVRFKPAYSATQAS